MITAITGLVTAVGGLLTILVQAGVIGSAKAPRSNADPAKPAAVTQSAVIAGQDTSPADLEGALERANIQLGAGDAAHIAEVRRYMSDPDGAYARLAQASLDVLGGRRLKRRGYLDMIDKWYTKAVGENRYLSEGGGIRHRELMDAMLNAANEIDGTQAASLDDIVTNGR
jgi:hypothetical protein